MALTDEEIHGKYKGYRPTGDTEENRDFSIKEAINHLRLLHIYAGQLESKYLTYQKDVTLEILTKLVEYKKYIEAL